MARGAALAALCALLAVAVGCGEEEGVAEGSTVSVYVAASLCAEAEEELARKGGQAGEVRVRVLCLADQQSGERLDLAMVGANARRATEDSTAVGYLELPGPATRFSRPILDEAGIAWIDSDSGRAAMSRLLAAIADADLDALRESVREELGED